MKLATFAKQFQAKDQRWIDPRTGNLDPDPYEFMRALYNRTGAADGLIPSVGTPLTATGNTFAMALGLTDDWNEVLTVAAGAGVAIPALQQTQQILIFNGGLNPLKVYPQPAASIDALAVGVAYSLAVGKTQIFSFWTLTRIRSLQLG